MKPDERVLGLDLGDVQIAYPINYLNKMEIVEHAVGGAEILVCWCPLCGTAVVQDRRVDGRTFTFGHSGWLWHNAFLLYDRETDSLWHHETGVAMTGAMRGRRMPLYENTSIMTFAAWRAEHPETLVLVKPADPRIGVDADGYDARNARRLYGVAISPSGVARYYPLASMAALDAVEDEVGGTPVVVVHDAAASAARAYDRRVEGKTLSFDVEKTVGSRPLLRERGGARAWFLLSGIPVPESGARAPLRPLAATLFEADAWTLQHPTGSVWRRP
jgi:hypothetical protein